MPTTIEAGGRRLRYLEMGAGEGPPVVFIHGFGGDLYSWQFNQEALAEGHVTYALDLPGHGGSTKDLGSGHVHVGALAAAVIDFMDAKAIAEAHLVGHSLGGAVALDLALNHPERVASATLVCSAALGPEINMAYIDGFMQAKRRKQLQPVLEMLVADPATVSRDMIEEVLKYKRLDGVEAALDRIAGTIFAGGRQALELKGRLGALDRAGAGDLGQAGSDPSGEPRRGAAGRRVGHGPRPRRPHGAHGEGRRGQPDAACVHRLSRRLAATPMTWAAGVRALVLAALGLWLAGCATETGGTGALEVGQRRQVIAAIRRYYESNAAEENNACSAPILSGVTRTERGVRRRWPAGRRRDLRLWQLCQPERRAMPRFRQPPVHLDPDRPTASRSWT